METRSGGNEDVDRFVQLDDLSLKTLIALVDRLRETETTEQFLCRELELDSAYLNAEVEIRAAESDEKKKATLPELQRILALVTKAHDFVGESNIRAAVQELNRVIEMKIGL